MSSCGAFLKVFSSIAQLSRVHTLFMSWEDSEFLKQQFPRATIWSHHGAQEAGNVTAALTVPSPTTGQARRPSSDGLQAKRSSRPKFQNVRVSRPEWAGEAVINQRSCPAQGIATSCLYISSQKKKRCLYILLKKKLAAYICNIAFL